MKPYNEHGLRIRDTEFQREKKRLQFSVVLLRMSVLKLSLGRKSRLMSMCSFSILPVENTSFEL